MIVYKRGLAKLVVSYDAGTKSCFFSVTRTRLRHTQKKAKAWATATSTIVLEYLLVGERRSSEGAPPRTCTAEDTNQREVFTCVCFWEYCSKSAYLFSFCYTIPLSSKDVTKDGRPRASVRFTISVLWREKKSPTERTSQAETGRKAPSGATHREKKGESGNRLATRLNRCKPRSNSLMKLFFGIIMKGGAVPSCVFYMPCGRPSQHEKIRCGAS